MNIEKLNKMDSCRHLLPEPGAEVVGELIAELRKAQDHLELAWGVIANAGHRQGGWETQDKEWVEAAERWRDTWHNDYHAGEPCCIKPGADILANASRSPARPCSSFYVVKGYCLVPHEVEMWVEAETPKAAMEKAKEQFKKSPNKRNWIVGGSEDETSAFDFEPNSAMPPLNSSSKDANPEGSLH